MNLHLNVNPIAMMLNAEQTDARSENKTLTAFELIGRVGDTKEDFVVLTKEDADSEKYHSHRHASHTMIFARDDAVLWDNHKVRAAVMMQMRFDGVLGFPGGLVDEGETSIHAALRELQEEIDLDIDKYTLTSENYICSFLHQEKNLVLHFFGLEVSLKDFQEIERNSLNADDYGTETLGIIRPPLFTMADNARGFPAFLTNQFAGNAREELFLGLQHFNILSLQELNIAVIAAEKLKIRQLERIKPV